MKLNVIVLHFTHSPFDFCCGGLASFLLLSNLVCYCFVARRYLSIVVVVVGGDEGGDCVNSPLCCRSIIVCLPIHWLSCVRQGCATSSLTFSPVFPLVRIFRLQSLGERLGLGWWWLWLLLC